MVALLKRNNDLVSKRILDLSTRMDSLEARVKELSGWPEQLQARLNGINSVVRSIVERVQKLESNTDPLYMLAVKVSQNQKVSSIIAKIRKLETVKGQFNPWNLTLEEREIYIKITNEIEALNKELRKAVLQAIVDMVVERLLQG